MMAEKLAFTKYQALGNDFIVVDVRDRPAIVEDKRFAIGVLDRHFGAGADDLIFVSNSTVADVQMRIRTPSGGWLTMCGNGIRCFARFVWDSGISRADPLRVETDSGIREVISHEGLIEVDLLKPDLRATAIPTSLAVNDSEVLDAPLNLGPLGEVRVSCVSVGNPHAVFFVDDLDTADMDVLGPGIEQHAAFPKGVNVHAAQVLAPERARIATWERGAGRTLA